MDTAFQEIAKNTALLAAMMSWLLAQALKFVIGLVTDGEINLVRLVKSGGMPSSHAAFVTSVSVGVGKQHGFDSGVFALAAVVALVIMYDAAGVRQAVGIQAQTLNELLHDLYSGSAITPVKIREILGHTPVEVIAGAVLGLIVALIL